MKDEKRVIAELKEERRALVKELKKERENLKEAEKKANEISAAYKRRERKLGERERAVSKMENAAKIRYTLELNQLKLFADRIKRLAESDRSILSKLELIDLFKDFLKEIDATSAKEKIKAISEKLPYGPEEETFDLDDILSPKGELDLKKLCEELGVLPEEN